VLVNARIAIPKPPFIPQQRTCDNSTRHDRSVPFSRLRPAGWKTG
jgi:hypothetical protein